MKKTNPETLNQPIAEAPLEDKEKKTPNGQMAVSLTTICWRALAGDLFNS